MKENSFEVRRVCFDINWLAQPRYVTFNNYRKWSLAGGRGGPAEQLVDSASLSVHVDANVSSSLSPLPLLFDTSVSKITFIASNLQSIHLTDAFAI